MIKLCKAFLHRVKAYLETDEERTQKLIEYIKSHGGEVGQNVSIYDSNIDCAEPYLLSIGDNTTITGARILTHDASTKRKLGYSKVGKVIIGKNVFIGWGSIILCNTTIGDDSIIGAGCVVAKDVPPNSVVVGNPMRILCNTDEYYEKIVNDMQDSIVIDRYPPEILGTDFVRTLREHGKGYTL